MYFETVVLRLGIIMYSGQVHYSSYLFILWPPSVGSFEVSIFLPKSEVWAGKSTPNQTVLWLFSNYMYCDRSPYTSHFLHVKIPRLQNYLYQLIVSYRLVSVTLSSLYPIDLKLSEGICLIFCCTHSTSNSCAMFIIDLYVLTILWSLLQYNHV